MVARSTKWILGVCGSGIALILLGSILGWVGFPAIVKSQVADTVPLKNGTDSWDRWIELPLPMQFKVTIFDIQNAEGITNGEDPIFIERGPYVYKETRWKEEIDYNQTEDKASYYQRSMFEFDPEASNGTEDDFVTVTNIPLVSFAQITESIEPLASSISSFNDAVEKMWTSQNGTIFTYVTVKDYLFNGIPMFCNQDETLQNVPVKLLCIAFKQVAPKTVIIDEDAGINYFAFFHYKNNTFDGRYEVRLGIDDVEKIGDITLWEGETHTDKWGGETCNRIHGTDSTIFRPDLFDVDELTIFNTDICRTVKLTYLEDVTFKDVNGRRYVASADVFGNVERVEDNYCYCPQTVSNLTSRGGCLRDGALDLSSCQGAPVVLTFAHFLHADESYKQNLPDLKPNKEKHQIFLDLEPYTGTPLRGASRIQMNVHLKPIPEVDMMKNFKGQILPVLWLEEGVELNDELMNMLQDELLDILNILNIVRWVLVAVGIALVVGSGGFWIYKKYF